MTGDKKLSDEPSALGEPETFYPRFTLLVTRQSPMPTGPITLNGWTTIIDPEKFTEATLSDIASYVAAQNKGRDHWASDLIEEKIQALSICGVTAEIREVQ